MREDNLIKKEKILRLPSWIKFPISKASEFEKIQTLIKKSNIHTICEEARCPNRAECYAQEQPPSYWVDPYVLVHVLFVR